MENKWLGLSPWRSGKEESHRESGNGKASVTEAEVHTPRVVTASKKVAAEEATFEVELLPLAEIYRAAGIMSPRRGYSIEKVVEMVNSEHIRGLSKELKRAAVLMALNAAGVLIGEVVQDAKARQHALDAYEVEQKKQLEGEWARKEEENSRIEAELERVKAQYMLRMSRNMDAVARQKAIFATWLETKQQQCQNISEAAELCLKPAVAEPVHASSAEVSAEVASSKPV